MMIENEKIDVRQFLLLVVIFTIGTSILVAPGSLATGAKQDAWLAGIMGVAFGLLYVLLFYALGRRFPEKSLVEYSEEILGKWLGKLVSLFYVSFFLLISSILLREMGDFITTEVMPETPIQAIHIIFISIVMIATRLGLEVLARTAQILFPWIIGLLIVLILCLTPQVEFQKFQPIFEHGIKSIFGGSFLFQVTPFSQYVVFLMIFPYVNKQNEIKKAFLIGAFLGGLVIVILTALCISVLGVDFTIRSVYPSYHLAKKIHVGNFLQRIEALLAGVWFITIFFKLTIFFYASTLTFAQLLELNSYRSLTIPFGVIIVILSTVISPNIIYMHTYTVGAGIPWGLTYGLVIPLLLVAVAIARRKGIRQ